MEKLKENKKLIIGIIAVLVVIIAIGLIMAFVKPSYKTQIKKFAEACESKEKMEKYVEKYIDFRALYAIQKSEEPEDFEEEYKKAKKSDYKDDEFVNDVKEMYTIMAEADEVKVKEIEKLKSPKDMGKIYEESFGKIKGMKIARCTLKVKQEGEEEEIKADVIFYKGKLVSFSISLDQV